MATRAEQFRAQSQRKGKKKAKRTKAPRKRKHTRTRKEARATYALETTKGEARPSRKSTRKSANRIKPDSPFNRTEELRGSAPEKRADRASIARVRPRGKR